MFVASEQKADSIVGNTEVAGIFQILPQLPLDGVLTARRIASSADPDAPRRAEQIELDFGRKKLLKLSSISLLLRTTSMTVSSSGRSMGSGVGRNDPNVCTRSSGINSNEVSHVPDSCREALADFLAVGR